MNKKTHLWHARSSRFCISFHATSLSFCERKYIEINVTFATHPWWFCRRYRTWLKGNFKFSVIIMMHPSKLYFPINSCDCGSWAIVIFKAIRALDLILILIRALSAEIFIFHLWLSLFRLLSVFMPLLFTQRACLNLIFFPFTHLLLPNTQTTWIVLIAHCDTRVKAQQFSDLLFTFGDFSFSSRLPQVKNGSWHSIYEFSYPFPCDQYIIYGFVVFFATKLKATAVVAQSFINIGWQRKLSPFPTFIYDELSILVTTMMML